jgi:hypothetical protein
MNATVSSAKYSDPPSPTFFVVNPSDSFDFSDKRIEMRIVTLIENKLVEHGYRKATLPEIATVEVYYKYSIGPGQAYGSNSRDIDDSRMLIKSLTEYPNYFQINIMGIERPKNKKKIEMIWQGEVYGSGENMEILELANYLIDVLFDNFDITVANKKYSKRLSLQ